MKKLRLADPVDASTGNFYETATDVAAGGRGTGLSFTRTYNSAMADVDGWLGRGWWSNWEMSLDIDSGSVTLHQEGAAQATFVKNPSGGWDPGPYVNGSLSYDSGSDTWTLVRNLAETLVFRGDGHLVSITDINGYKTTLGYPSGSSLPSSVTESTDVSGRAGRSLALGWSGSHLASVTDPMGRVTNYTVGSTSGSLDAVTDPRGAVSRFTYDATSDELLTMQSPQEAVLHPSDATVGATTMAYDGAGRVTDQWSPTATSGVSGVNTNRRTSTTRCPMRPR